MGQAALTVYHALGLSVYSRADFIVDQEGTPGSWRSTPCRG
ncbi:MAG: hypothetical protein ACLR1T_09355 [Evtepia gabavorous]